MDSRTMIVSPRCFLPELPQLSEQVPLPEPELLQVLPRELLPEPELLQVQRRGPLPP